MFRIEPQDQRPNCILFYYQAIFFLTKFYYQAIAKCLLIFYILLYILTTFRCYIKKIWDPKVTRSSVIAHFALAKGWIWVDIYKNIVCVLYYFIKN